MSQREDSPCTLDEALGAGLCDGMVPTRGLNPAPCRRVHRLKWAPIHCKPDPKTGDARRLCVECTAYSFNKEMLSDRCLKCKTQPSVVLRTDVQPAGTTIGRCVPLGLCSGCSSLPPQRICAEPECTRLACCRTLLDETMYCAWHVGKNRRPKICTECFKSDTEPQLSALQIAVYPETNDEDGRKPIRPLRYVPTGFCKKHFVQEVCAELQHLRYRFLCRARDCTKDSGWRQGGRCDRHNYASEVEDEEYLMPRAYLMRLNRSQESLMKVLAQDVPGRENLPF